jgi:hypothetical protein
MPASAALPAPGRESEFREGVDLAIEYAKALGCPQLNCLIGIPPKGAAPEAVRRTVVDNLAHAARALDQARIRLLIEPVNFYDIPGFWLQHADQGVALIEEIGSDNLWLELHGNRMIERTFNPGFRIELHQKDLNLALQGAKSLGISLPNTATCQELFNACVAHGGAAWDHSAMVRALEIMANHQVARAEQPRMQRSAAE